MSVLDIKSMLSPFSQPFVHKYEWCMSALKSIIQ